MYEELELLKRLRDKLKDKTEDFIDFDKLLNNRKEEYLLLIALDDYIKKLE